ncbi:hypothetical protein J437_LFUL016919 [Ladona fulva]|uniref:Uncharacterized protein n=1 Tax=Ladona fulva TaxID=123851 RepID=A0A8K0P9V2_LADFU|nr:hypothetical protein J437_LFUL016919 [Ladona fulva]
MTVCIQPIKLNSKHIHWRKKKEGETYRLLTEIFPQTGKWVFLVTRYASLVLAIFLIRLLSANCLTANELKRNKSGNCSPQGAINILLVSSSWVASSSQFLVNDEENFYALNCLMTVKTECHDYYPLLTFLTLYTERVIKYISEFAVK